MKENKTFKIRERILKSTIAIVLSIVLTITGLNVDMKSYAVSTKQEVVKDDLKITNKQKEEAKQEDAKVSRNLEEIKEKKEQNKKADVVKELKKFRTSNSSTYLLSDGSKKLEIYGEDIRYKENGEYVDYNPSLKKISKSEEKELLKNKGIAGKFASKEYAYINTAGDAKHYFPAALDGDSAVVLTKKNYAIAFSPVKQTDEKQKHMENDKKVEEDKEKNNRLNNNKKII